jgi:hypothetical protein
MKKLLFLSVLVVACSDGGGSEPEKELVYVETTPPTTGVHLHLVTLDDQSLTLEVVGKGITNLYGLAFRLQYDPEFLDFTEMTPAAGWPADAISIARKNPAGTLVAAITNRGPATGLDAQDQVLATLRFTLMNKGESGIDLITRNCALVDTTGAQIPDLTWSGGALELQ